MASRPSAGTALGGSVAGSSVFGLAQIAGTWGPYIEFIAPTLTAFFMFIWPRILMRIEHRSDLADLKRVTRQVATLKLDEEARKKMDEELKNRSEELGKRLIESLKKD